MKIKSLDGHEPHASWGGWEEFLKSCEVRDRHDGVTYYSSSNCNYLVFPDGTLVGNYGFHAKALMTDVRQKGAEWVLASLVEIHKLKTEIERLFELAKSRFNS